MCWFGIRILEEQELMKGTMGLCYIKTYKKCPICEKEFSKKIQKKYKYLLK